MPITASRISSSTSNTAPSSSSDSSNSATARYDVSGESRRHGIGGNSIDPLFFEVLRALDDLSQLPDYHSFHLDAEVVRRARRVIDYLVQNYNIPLPKLLLENSECLSFTWENNSIKRYLSLTNDDVDLTFFDRSDGTSYLETLCEDGELNRDSIAKALNLAITPVNKTSD